MKLTKPADNETADIEVINTNMDVIDAAVSGKEPTLATEQKLRIKHGTVAPVSADGTWDIFLVHN